MQKKRQTGCGQPKRIGRETEQKEGRNRKENEMRGEGGEKGEREPGRGRQGMWGMRLGKKRDVGALGLIFS